MQRVLKNSNGLRRLWAFYHCGDPIGESIARSQRGGRSMWPFYHAGWILGESGFEVNWTTEMHVWIGAARHLHGGMIDGV